VDSFTTANSFPEKDAIQRMIDGVEVVVSSDPETEAMIERLPESVRIFQSYLKILSLNRFNGD